MAVLFWLVIIVVCIFAEIHTNAFIAVFVGAGAIVPFFLALASVPVRRPSRTVARHLGRRWSARCVPRPSIAFTEKGSSTSRLLRNQP